MIITKHFRQHISQTCRCCFGHIRDLRRIRRHMSFDVTKTIATALVSSRLDYCNSLYHNSVVRYRIIFKICTLTYQALSSKQPASLHSLLTPARQPRRFRSSNSNLLLFPVVRQMSELKLSRFLHRLCGINYLLVLSL